MGDYRHILRLESVHAFPGGGQDCGDYTWAIQWYLSNGASGPKGGFVLQHIVVKFEITDCDDKDITLEVLNKRLGKVGNADGGKTFDFREAFEFDKDQYFSKRMSDDHEKDDDTYKGEYFGFCTKGKEVTTGRASYHEGNVPASFTPKNPKTLAGSVPSTVMGAHTDFPKIAAGTKVVNHDLTVEWDCCGPDKKGVRAKTKKVYQDPQK